MRIALVFGALFVALMIFGYGDSWGQMLQLTLVEPPVPSLRLSDLWLCSVVNLSAGPIEIILRATVTEAQRGEIAVLTSSPVTVQTGFRRLDGFALEPIAVQRIAEAARNNLQRTNSFPDGTYHVLLEAIKRSSGEVLGSTFYDHTVVTALPPILLSPYDGSDVTENNVVWTWFMQPTTGAGGEIVCELKVVEILGSQTAEEALRVNPPVIIRRNLTVPAWQTNFAVRSFMPGRRYCWRITAFSGGATISESEIWKFTYNQPILPDSSAILSENTLKSVEPSSENTEYTSEIPVADNIASAPPDTTLPVLTGSTRVTLESSNRQATLAETPVRYARWEINPKIRLFDIPIGANLLLSTEKNSRSSSLDRAGLVFDRDGSEIKFALRDRVNQRVQAISQARSDSLLMVLEQTSALDSANYAHISEEFHAARGRDPVEDAEYLRRMGLLTASEVMLVKFPSFGMGQVSPQFSELTLSGVTIDGAMVEYNPGMFYLGAAVGKALRDVPFDILPPQIFQSSTNGGTPEFHRTLYCGRAGLGNIGRNYVVATLMYSADDEQAEVIQRLLDSSGARLAPQSNVVLGIAFHAQVDSANLFFDGEINSSIFTEDVNAPRIEDPGFNAGAGGILGAQPSSSKNDHALSLRAAWLFDRKKARFSASGRIIGAGYRTVGVAGLRSDVRSYTLEYDHYYLENAVHFNGQAGLEESGFMLRGGNTSSILRYAGMLDVRFPRLPMVQIAYSMNDQNLHFAVTQNQLSTQATRFSANCSYMGVIFSMRAATSFSYISQIADSPDSINRFSSSTFLFSQRFVPSAEFSIIFNVSRTATETFADRIGAPVWAGGLAGVISPWQYWRNTIGLRYTESSASKSSGIYITSEYDLFNSLTLSLNIEHTLFRNQANNAQNFDESIARLTTFARW